MLPPEDELTDEVAGSEARVDRVVELEARLEKLEQLDSLQTYVLLDLWALALRVRLDTSREEYNKYLNSIEASMQKVIELRTGKSLGDGNG